MRIVATAQSVPMFDLRPVLARAAGAIQANLDAMHADGQYILGPQVETFERELAVAFGAAYAVGCGSGTAALELCLRAAGVTNPGDEVVVPANTSLFTAQAVLAAGARPRIADVDAETLLLTRESVERALTPNVRAVIAVHLFGHAAPLAELAELCRGRGIVLIQDACQAHGLRYQGLPLTEYSGYTAYSFYPTKNLGCLGDGGAVLTNCPDARAGLRLLRDGGRAGDQMARIQGINSRLDEIHACYLRAFLPHLEAANEHRRCIAAVYEDAFAGLIRTVPFQAGDVHHLYVIRTARRDELRAWLREREIGTGIHYPVTLDSQPAFAGSLCVAAPPINAAAASQEVLSLPIGPHVSEEAARRVAEEVLRFHR